jgi:hypothetical protein
MGAAFTFEDAVQRLASLDEWVYIRTHFSTERESLITEFQQFDVATNPYALANLAGKIEVMDTVLASLGGPPIAGRASPYDGIPTEQQA